MKSVFAIVLICLLPAFINAQAKYTFMYEKGWSANSGAENLVAANYLYGKLDEKYIPATIFKNETFSGKAGNALYRFSKVLLIDVQLNVWAFVVQHEYFGHTVRAKQGGYYNAYPHIGFPYCYKQPLTYLGSNYTGVSNIEYKIIYAGGNEANIILANKIMQNALIDKNISNQQSIQFFHNNSYQSLGILIMKNPNKIVDIEEYNKRTVYFENSEKTEQHFRIYAWIDFLSDPLNYVAIYSVLYNYIYKGKYTTEIPMIKITDRIYYLPDYRFNLAPYSPESVYDNYFRIDKKLLKISFHHSVLTIDNSFGFNFKLFNYKIAPNIIFDTEVDVWKQYFLLSDFNIKSSSGFAILHTIHFRLIDKYSLSLTATGGYKTKGYLEGEKLKEGLILRGGMSFHLK